MRERKILCDKFLLVFVVLWSPIYYTILSPLEISQKFVSFFDMNVCVKVRYVWFLIYIYNNIR